MGSVLGWRVVILAGGWAVPLGGAFAFAPRLAGRNRGVVRRRLGSVATSLDEEVARHALSFFVADPAATFEATEGGANNAVQYVRSAKVVPGGTCVLRVYNNGLDMARVVFEHEVLAALHTENDAAAKKLSFALPRYFERLDGSGSTMATLEQGPSAGTQACVCQLIPGALPKTQDPKPLGAAVGELLEALTRADPRLEGKTTPTFPYWDIYNAHVGVGGDKAKFYEYLKTEVFDGCREAITDLVAECAVVDGDLAKLLALPQNPDGSPAMPSQIIHGDLHYDNVLCDPATGQVTGLLDFEFCERDWRVMELAVCLSKYVGEADPLPLIDRFLEGFGECGVRLNEAEVEALPTLINLRVMSNAVYFVGRALTGEDSIKALTSRARMYADRMVWVRTNKGAIVDCIAGKMAQLAQEEPAIVA